MADILSQEEINSLLDAVEDMDIKKTFQPFYSLDIDGVETFITPKEYPDMYEDDIELKSIVRYYDRNEINKKYLSVKRAYTEVKEKLTALEALKKKHPQYFI